jgi:cytochrome b561
MTTNRIDRHSYDRRTIRLHWLTAFLVAALWILGQTIDWFPRGTPRGSARSTHIVLGALLAVVVVYRIWWRSTAGRRLPPADEGFLRLLSIAAHRALYVLLCVTVALGIANAWVRGDAVFGLFRIPSFAPGDKALRGTIENLHQLSANVLLGLAGLHALAGLAHYFVWKDRVLQRMGGEVGKDA